MITSKIKRENSKSKSSNIAVITRNVCLSYEQGFQKSAILNGVNLNVPKASIYGLLGPSGCGKTSLLKVVVGLLAPESGFVSVFGFKPGSKESGVPGIGLGYMPQEIGLQSNLSVEETMMLFGRLYHLDKHFINDQIDKLRNLFQLPQRNHLVANMSGGQQRRLSLAVAILHKPRLLILDEPTVGVDPILCKIIWDTLFDLSRKESITIIVTTHYIEEMKRAHVIGFMRKGQILIESQPMRLIQKFRTKTLEQCFYLLSQEQKRRKSTVLSTHISRRKSILDEAVRVEANESGKEPLNANDQTFFHDLLSVYSILIWKYVLQTYREPGAVFISNFVQVLSIIAFAYLIDGYAKGIEVAWVSDEQPSNLSEILLIKNETIDLSMKNFSTNVTSFDEEYDDGFTDEYNVYLPNIFRSYVDTEVINLKNYSSLLCATHDLFKNKVSAIIWFESNFTKNYYERDLFTWSPEGYVSNQTIDAGAIHLIIGQVNKFVHDRIRSSLEDSFKHFSSRAAILRGQREEIQKFPLEVSEPIYGKVGKASEADVRSYILSSLIVLVAFGNAFAVSSLLFLTELKDQTLFRCYTAGLTVTQLIVSLTIAVFIFTFIGGISQFLLAVYYIGVPCKGSKFVAILLVIVQLFSGISYGLVTVLLIPSITACFLNVISISLLNLYATGILFPIQSMPYYLAPFARLWPNTEPSLSLRNLMILNVPFYPSVFRGLSIASFYFLIFLLISITLLKSRI